MSRTAAIEKAKRYVTIGAHGRQYVVYLPYRFSDLEGPNTHGHPSDWWAARANCTRNRAALALHLMGMVGTDWITVLAVIEHAHGDGITELEDLVAHVAARLVHA
jgi:hypothetical protein